MILVAIMANGYETYSPKASGWPKYAPIGDRKIARELAKHASNLFVSFQSQDQRLINDEGHGIAVDDAEEFLDGRVFGIPS